MTDLSGLVRDDGAVIIPPSVAGEVLRLLARALLDDARAYGGRPSPAARQLLTALYQAAQHQPDDTPDPAAPAGSCSVAEAALLMGCHPSWVRHLLAHGRLAGRRSGGVWLVDLPLATSLANRDAA